MDNIDFEAPLGYPFSELRFIELALKNVEIAHLRMFRPARRLRLQRRAPKKRHLHVCREAMQAEKPRIIFNAIKWRVSFHGCTDIRDHVLNYLVDRLANIAFLPRHGSDMGLYRLVIAAFGDLRIAAGQKLGLCRVVHN